MHKRIQETKQFMMKLTDNQLEMTTKRTIMENEQMSAEMAYQSRQSTALLGQNQALDTRLVELKQALALSRETENELAKRNTIYQSTIKQLVRGPHARSVLLRCTLWVQTTSVAQSLSFGCNWYGGPLSRVHRRTCHRRIPRISACSAWSSSHSLCACS